MAALFGAKGFRIAHPDEAGDVIQAAFKAEGPVVVDVIVDPDELAETVRKDAVKRRIA